MSKISVEHGPPRDGGMLDSILAKVTAVAISPSRSTRSEVPVGKNGKISVNDATNILGSEYMIEICSKITSGEWKDARNATCRSRTPYASLTNKSGNPSGNFRQSMSPSSTAAPATS